MIRELAVRDEDNISPKLAFIIAVMTGMDIFNKHANSGKLPEAPRSTDDEEDIKRHDKNFVQPFAEAAYPIAAKFGKQFGIGPKLAARIVDVAISYSAETWNFHAFSDTRWRKYWGRFKKAADSLDFKLTDAKRVSPKFKKLADQLKASNDKVLLALKEDADAHKELKGIWRDQVKTSAREAKDCLDFLRTEDFDDIDQDTAVEYIIHGMTIYGLAMAHQRRDVQAELAHAMKRGFKGTLADLKRFLRGHSEE